MRFVGKRSRHLALGAAFLAALALAGQEPSSLDRKTYPAQDAHEGVTVAARPVPDTPEAEEIFGKNAAAPRAGILPVELVILNQRSEPVRVNLERILVVTDVARFAQVEPAETAWALYPSPKSKKPARTGSIPRPPEDKNRNKREEAEAALRSRQLRAGVVGPGGQARGYRYFDLRSAELDLTQARVYIPEVVTLPEEQPLFFFEISLKPYARD